jgi:hypothetical protein
MKGLFFTPIDIISLAFDLIQIPFQNPVQAVVLKGDFFIQLSNEDSVLSGEYSILFFGKA